MATITITNPTRTRKWGFEYTTGFDTNLRVIPADEPRYTGTLDSVLRQIENDATFQSIKSGGTVYAPCWFYAGQRLYLHSVQAAIHEIEADREWARSHNKPVRVRPVTVETL